MGQEGIPLSIAIIFGLAILAATSMIGAVVVAVILAKPA